MMNWKECGRSSQVYFKALNQESDRMTNKHNKNSQSRYQSVLQTQILTQDFPSTKKGANFSTTKSESMIENFARKHIVKKDQMIPWSYMI
jgi:hypothetical protein